MNKLMEIFQSMKDNIDIIAFENDEGSRFVSFDEVIKIIDEGCISIILRKEKNS